MTDEVWRERDTTPGKIEAALRNMLDRAPPRRSDAFVPARVLNLVVVVDGEFRGEIENRLERVGPLPPVAARDLRGRAGRARRSTRGRAWAPRTPSRADLASARERVELDIGERHLQGSTRSSTRCWSPTSRRCSGRRTATPRRSTRCAASRRSCWSTRRTSPTSPAALARAAELLRGRLRRRPRVAALDAVARARRRRVRPAGAAARRSARSRAVTVRHRADSLAAALLFCGWLCVAPGLAARLVRRGGGKRRSGARAGRRAGGHAPPRARSSRPARPGLAGVTIEIASGAAVSLDRGPGGLRVGAPRRATARSRCWTVLGASRGEGGILGEGVRQALLRDPTYGPALAVQRAGRWLRR